MSETKHTPGPWRLEKQVAGRDWTSIGAPVATVGGEALCESVEFIVGTVSDFGPHGEQETEANARLIAAAPELLDALRQCVIAIGDELNASSQEEVADHPVLAGHQIIYDDAKALISKTEEGDA